MRSANARSLLGENEEKIMGNPTQKIKTSESTCPAALLKDEIPSRFQSFWAIRNLDILMKGDQPIVVCPARNIARMRISSDWKKLIDQGRLLILSPFDEQQKRPTVSTAQQRNHLVAMLSLRFLIPYAYAGSKTEQLGRESIQAGKMVFSFQSGKSRLGQFGAKTIEPTIEAIG